VFDTMPVLKNKVSAFNDESCLLLLLMHRPVVDILAKYAHDVLGVYDAKDIYIVDSSVYENDVVNDPVIYGRSLDIML
jgi:hypothetical protein